MALTFFPEPDSEEKEIRAAVRSFANQYLRPTAIEDDERAHFRREVFNALAAKGFISLSLPKRYGGKEMPHRYYYAFIEELARASMSMGVAVGVTNLVIGALLAYGSEEQKDEYLPKLVSGEFLGAFSLSEPQSGSDAAALKLSAKARSGSYVLNGTKMWCSNAGHADLYLVMSRTGEDKVKGITSFLVPKETKGFRIGKQEKKLGLRASTLAELVFEECEIADRQRIGEEGEGFPVALSQLDAGRLAIGVVGVGLAMETLERAWTFCQRQPTFMEGTQQLFAEDYASIQAIRSLAAQAAILKDEKKSLTLIAAQVKLLGSDLAMRVSGNAVHFMGEPGYLRENEVERLMRDAKALQIVEGTNQIQKIVLAREMQRMMHP